MFSLQIMNLDDIFGQRVFFFQKLKLVLAIKLIPIVFFVKTEDVGSAIVSIIVILSILVERCMAAFSVGWFADLDVISFDSVNHFIFFLFLSFLDVQKAIRIGIVIGVFIAFIEQMML